MKIPFIISITTFTFASCLFSYGDAYQMSDTEKKFIQNIEEAISKGAKNYHKSLPYAAECGYVNTVKKLLDAGVDVNVSDYTKATALHKAASRGRLEVVKVLIQAGADVNAETNRGYSPLELASENGHLEIVKTLIQAGADANKMQNALKLASKNGHTEIVKIFDPLNQNTQINETKIQDQQLSDAEKEYIKIVDGFISSPGFTTRKNSSLCYKYLSNAAEKGYAYAIKRLLDAGVDVNLSDRNNVTALHHAASPGHLEVVKVLIQAGANVNAAKYCGDTPLHYAAQRGHIDVVKELIQSGAGANYLASGGKKPSEWAKEKGHHEIVQFLAPYTIDLCDPLALVDSMGKGHWRDIDAIFQAKSKRIKHFPEYITINTTTKYGTSALHKAAENGHVETVDYLVQNKANVNILDFLNMTPLHSAATMGHSDIISTLLEAGANINAVSTTGNTALILAATHGHVEAVKTLILAGADVNMTNMFGYTALHQAKRKGHTEVVNILTEAGAK